MATKMDLIKDRFLPGHVPFSGRQAMKTAETTMTKIQEAAANAKKNSPLLRKRGTTTTFPWTETLARRADMEPYWPVQGQGTASNAASLSGMTTVDAKKGERPPFLRKHGTKIIFPWTVTLSKRADMEPYWPPVEGDVVSSGGEVESDDQLDPLGSDATGPGPGIGGLMQHMAPVPSLVDPGPPPASASASEDQPEAKVATEEALKGMSMSELRAHARENYQMTFPPSTRREEILTEMIELLNEETIDLSSPDDSDKI